MSQVEIHVLLVENSLALSSVQTIPNTNDDLEIQTLPYLKQRDLDRNSPNVVLFDKNIENHTHWKNILNANPQTKFYAIDLDAQEIETFNLQRLEMQSPNNLLNLIFNAHQLIEKESKTNMEKTNVNKSWMEKNIDWFALAARFDYPCRIDSLSGNA